MDLHLSNKLQNEINDPSLVIPPKPKKTPRYPPHNPRRSTRIDGMERKDYADEGAALNPDDDDDEDLDDAAVGDKLARAIMKD